MQGSRPGGASATARRAYRAVLPLGLRRSLRDRLSRLAPGLVPARRPKRDPDVRRFDLPLPSPIGAGAEPSRRDSLRIEAPRRLWIAGELHRGGVAAYEPATTSVMLGLAGHLRPEVVFDVGANIGPNSLLIPAILDVPVVAFEPDPNVAAALSRIVELNDLRCTVEASAVGERDEMATLFISPSDPSTSLRAGFREATGETIVPVRSLDSYVRDTGRRPSLLKIDTETTEPAVFRGATDLLASRPWIICEILPGWTESEVESLLLPLGYQAFQIVDTWPLPRRASLDGHASFEDANWLFAPETPTAELWDAIEHWRRAIDACEPPRRKSSTATPT